MVFPNDKGMTVGKKASFGLELNIPEERDSRLAKSALRLFRFS